MAESQDSEGSARIDLWLWAVRVFKTRSLAAAACRGGKIRIDGVTAKPARLVRPGDRIEVRRGLLTRLLEVKGVVKKRVGAKLVDDLLIDHTPPEAYQQAAEHRLKGAHAGPVRTEGSGRPTKRDRRDLAKLAEEAAEREAAVAELMRKSID